MPEGDSLYQAAAALRPLLVGVPLLAVEIRHHPQPDLVGRHATRVESRGKHLLIHIEGNAVLHVHLGMTGAFHRYSPGERWQKPEGMARLVLVTETDVVVCFQPPDCERLDARGLDRHRGLVRLGPDLIQETCDLDEASRRARAPDQVTRPVLDVLLDQRVSAGIGNVYKSEVLFLCGVHPLTPTGELADETLADLFATARRLLIANRDEPRRTTTWGPTGQRHPASRLWVYGRGRRACLRCRTPLRTKRLGEHRRGTTWCPACQPRDR